MNRLEELGRVDAEKAKTKMGKRNLRQEKSRIVRELVVKLKKEKKLDQRQVDQQHQVNKEEWVEEAQGSRKKEISATNLKKELQLWMQLKKQLKLVDES